MYFATQTLRKKGTKQLVKLLSAKANSSTFCWHGPKVKLLNEQGKIFLDDIDKYTHIENELGQPVCGDPNSIDLGLKKYLVSKNELKKMRQKTLEEWFLRIKEKIKNLKKNDTVFCPFANGSRCPLMYEYFMKKVKAQVMFTTGTMQLSRVMVFKMFGKNFLYTDDEIAEFKFNQKLIKELI